MADQKISLRTLTDLLQPATVTLNPRPWLLYKPNPRDISKGVAGKLSFRAGLDPNRAEDAFPVFSGGCFISLAKQTISEGEYAKFDWSTEALVTSKLGKNDLGSFLLGYREHRVLGRDIPSSIRPIEKNAEGRWVPSVKTHVVGLVHKYEGDTTVLTWSFDPVRGSILAIRKKTGNRSVSMTLQEEIQFVAYLEIALKALLMTDV